MKTKNWPNVVIAIVVIACSVVLLGALTIALGGYHGKKGGRSLEIEFRDATGIKLHSPVRYAGAAAGAVTKLRYLTPAERQHSKDPEAVVRVTVRLDDGVPPIPSDAKAGLASETILGEKFIALNGGTQNAPQLADGAVIQATEGVGFDALASSARAAIDNVNHILTRLNGDYPQLVPKIADLLAHVDSLLSQGSNFIGSATGTMTNANGFVEKFREDAADAMSKLSALLVQGQGIATNTDHTILHVDALVKNNEQALHEILEELQVVSQNLKVVSTYTKSLTGTLATKPSRLIWSQKKNPLPTEQEILKSSKPISTEPQK
ncbi:MAG: MlaD family protein [Verrucomicrobiota bacterium]